MSSYEAKLDVEATVDVQDAFDKLSQTDKFYFIEENLDSYGMNNLISYIEEKGYKVTPEEE